MSEGHVSEKSGFFDVIKNYIDDQHLERFDVINGIYRGLQLAIFVIAAFVISDMALLLPDRKDDLNYCLIIRLIMLGSSGFYVWWCHPIYGKEGDKIKSDKSNMKYRSIIGIIILQIIGNGTTLIALKMDGGNSNYFSGVIMVFIGTAILIPFRSGLLVGKMAFMIIFYYAGLILDEGTFFISINSFSNLSMLIGGAAVSWYGSIMIHATCNSSLPNQSQEGPKKPKYITHLFQVSGAIASSIGTLFLPISNRIPEKHISMPAINIIGLNSSDGSIEYRNTSEYGISLETAQILTRHNQQEMLFDVKFKGESPKIIPPGETVRIYLKTQIDGEYFVDSISNISKFLTNSPPRSIRLFCFKIYRSPQ